jgi:hypothetical protein
LTCFADLELERIARRRKTNTRRRIGKVVIKQRNGRRIVVKKRRKLKTQTFNELTQPVTVKKKSNQHPSDRILTQSVIPEPPTNTNQPTPISHIKHTLSQAENFPAIIVTPRSTQGIISSQEILKRNREKKIKTLAFAEDKADEQVLVPSTSFPEEWFSDRSEAGLLTFDNPVPVSNRQFPSRQNQFSSNLADREVLTQPEDAFQKLVIKSQSQINSFQPTAPPQKQRNANNFKDLLEKARSETDFESSFQQEADQLDRKSPFLAPPHPAQQRDSNRHTEIRINTFDLEREQTEERLDKQSLRASFPLPAERFANIKEADLTSFDNSRTVLSQPFPRRQVLPKSMGEEAERSLQKPFGSEQNLLSLEEPRSSFDNPPTDFSGRFLLNNFPFPSDSESYTKDISNPAHSLFFGPPSSNINMEDGSYTIVTVFG